VKIDDYLHRKTKHIYVFFSISVLIYYIGNHGYYLETTANIKEFVL